MTPYSKVSWKEGTFLSPQHFQQFERALDAHLRTHTGGASAAGWGILQLAFNENGLARGRIELTRCVALLPDGTPVNVPEVDPVPFALHFELPETARALDVYLTLPALRPRVAVVSADPERGDVRFLEQVLEVPDDADPNLLEPVEVAVKNLRLVVGAAPDGAQVAIKLGELQRSADGMVVMRADYIPPLLRIGASPVLMRLLQDLASQVGTRARSIAATRFQSQGDGLDFASGDALIFWFFHTLNSHALVLQHVLSQPDTHPLRAYEALLHLLGGLSSFAFEAATLDSEYHHERLAECFGALERRIRALLARLFLTRFEIIPLLRKDHFWIARIADPGMRQDGEFFLGVQADLDASDLASRLPGACKIGSVDAIARLVRMAVGGVRTKLVIKPPSPIPTRTDTVYFQVIAEGPDWDAIRDSGAMAIYVPNWLPGVKLELIGLRPPGRS